MLTCASPKIILDPPLLRSNGINASPSHVDDIVPKS